MTETGCYACIHKDVCRFKFKFLDFPWKDTDQIRDCCISISKMISSNCFYFELIKDKETNDK
jgi:hypothetical protein